jgi:hypothetical protein
MKPSRRSAALISVACLAVPLAIGACNKGKPVPEHTQVEQLTLCGEVPACDQGVTVAADSPTLLVTDPAALSALPLKDVLENIIERADFPTQSPTQMLRKMFDTNNDSATGVFSSVPHCDSFENGAHINGPAAQCPRKEGALAESAGFFEPGHPDHFIPVAAVNRFDLTTISGGSCGEYRLIYAKESGLTNPDDRVFMILEATLPNPSPGCLLGCRPVAEYWQSLASEKDPAVLGQKLRTFFLEGLPEAKLGPPMQANNLGIGSQGGYNGGFTGQVRLSQHMGDEWELRQFSAGFDMDGVLAFVPVLVGNNPFPAYFELPVETDTDEQAMIKESFTEDFVFTSVDRLAAARVQDMSANVSLFFLSGESALGGDAINDYVSRAQGNYFLTDAIEDHIEEADLGADCPADDPLTADSIVRRAAVQSCAGCHAPAKFLGPERKLGCGMTFPESLGEVQIDEKGNRSPALKDVFLPHRAKVLSTYLQACNEEEIVASFAGTPNNGGGELRASRPRTLGGSSTH